MTFTLEPREKSENAKTNNNKFPVNILIRSTNHPTKRDAKRVICLLAAFSLRTLIVSGQCEVKSISTYL
jgi:hypothetical protein